MKQKRGGFCISFHLIEYPNQNRNELYVPKIRNINLDVFYWYRLYMNILKFLCSYPFLCDISDIQYVMNSDGIIFKAMFRIEGTQMSFESDRISFAPYSFILSILPFSKFSHLSERFFIISFREMRAFRNKDKWILCTRFIYYIYLTSKFDWISSMAFLNTCLHRKFIYWTVW